MAKENNRKDITAFAYDKRGRLISIGRNNYFKTHPLQARYAKYTDNPGRTYIHAELNAIIKARGRKIYKLVIIAVDKNGKQKSAAPCQCCQKAIRLYDIKVVEHT